MGVGVRRGVLSAAVFAAAAVGGVLGNRITNRWDAAAAAFVIVTLLGTGLAVWLDRISNRPEGGVASAPVVSATITGQGVQVGGGNQQVNHFGPTVTNPQAGRDITIGETINVDNRRGHTDNRRP